jgi:hypothetical protein
VRRKCWICVAILCITFLRAQSSEEKTITVSGSVLDVTTGLGISGAVVFLDAGPSKSQFQAAQKKAMEAAAQGRGADFEENETAFKPTPRRRLITDGNGSFSATIPEPLNLNLSVSKSSYQAAPGASLFRDFPEAELAHDVIFRMAALGAVEGRVLNGDGEPVPGLTVELITRSLVNGRRSFGSSRSVPTNDLGEFRMWNLAPGPVYVKVSGKLGTATGIGVTPTFADASEAYGPVYYPAAPDRSSAQTVDVTGGRSVRADFKIPAQPSVRIRGRLENLGSYNRAGMRLLRGGDPVANRASVDSASGAFQVFDVTPGDYILQAYSNPGGTVSFGQVAITVGKEDLTGVSVPLSTGVDVSGVIEGLNLGDDGPRQPGEVGIRMRDLRPRVTVQLVDPRELPIQGSQPPATVDADGRFTLKDMLPGKYLFSIQPVSGYIASIRSGSVDIRSDGLIVGSSPPQEVRVVVRQNGGRFKITFSAGAAGANPLATIVMVGPSGVPILSSASVRGGSFASSMVEPGDYTIYAWPVTKQVEYYSPEVLRALAAYATSARIQEGMDTEVAVKLVPEDVP